MKRFMAFVFIPETYEDHLEIQKLDPVPKKYCDVAIDSIGEPGHIWDRYAYIMPMDSGITQIEQPEQK